MDIMHERARLAEMRDKSRKYNESYDNPVITKPSPFLTIRDIVARYSRGELVSVPEKFVESPVFNDDVEHIEPYKSDLEMHQRVLEFKEEYEKVKKNSSSSSEPVDLSSGTKTVSEGNSPGNDSPVGE